MNVPVVADPYQWARDYFDRTGKLAACVPVTYPDGRSTVAVGVMHRAHSIRPTRRNRGEAALAACFIARRSFQQQGFTVQP